MNLFPRYLTIISCSVCILSIIVPLALYRILAGNYFYVKNVSSQNGDRAPSKWLLVGVVSAPENYLERGSVRDTWGRLLDADNSQLKFVVGKRLCEIPPPDRVSPYGCTDSRLSVPDGTTDETLFDTVVRSEPIGPEQESTDYRKTCYTGFTFGVVHSNITLRRLGVVNWAIARSDRPIVRVVVKNSATGDKLISASFIYDADKKASDIIWKQIAPIQLVSGFEAEVGVENLYPSSVEFCDAKLNTDTGVITFFDSVESSKSRIASDPDGCHLVAFSYTIQDVDGLKRFIGEKRSRRQFWAEETAKLRQNLDEESEIYGDIIYADIVDVYYNLSRKVQHLFDWAAEDGGWRYVMKTDDDVFVDAKSVAGALKESEADADSWDLWACFKTGWPISGHGKWRAPSLAGSDIYPEFPSGAGYIVGASATDLLASDRRHFEYGEDVRLGILTADADKIVRKRSGACRWSCDRASCAGDVAPLCNIQELTVVGVYLAWQQYEACQYRICQCVPADFIKTD